MTFPWILEIGNASIPMHPVIETAAIFIGFRYFLYLRNKHPDPIATSKRIYIVVGAMFGAMIGSRLIGGLEDPAALMSAENVLVHFYLNKTILGGLLGGLFGVELVKKFIGEHRPSGDLFTFPLILAMIIGRIGCFGMGVHEQTFGVETNLLFRMDLGDGLSRHPVTLYEIAFLICMWLFLAALKKRQPLAEGSSFKIFMIGYLTFRLILDFIKPHYNWPGGLSTIQLASIVGLVYYSTFIFKPRKLLAVYA